MNIFLEVFGQTNLLFNHIFVSKLCFSCLHYCFCIFHDRLCNDKEQMLAHVLIEKSSQFKVENKVNKNILDLSQISDNWVLWLSCLIAKNARDWL